MTCAAPCPPREKSASCGLRMTCRAEPSDTAACPDTGDRRSHAPSAGAPSTRESAALYFVPNDHVTSNLSQTPILLELSAYAGRKNCVQLTANSKGPGTFPAYCAQKSAKT